jgi:thiazolinyl imide reductase
VTATPPGKDAPLETVVCGSRFGQFYASAIASGDPRFRLAGVVGQGSDRSRALAARHGVPLYQAIDDLPETVDAACVVVSSAVAGGPGADLARSLLARGIHVLQEHPIHERELAQCLREARSHRTHYRLNTFYPHVEPVARFIRLARALVAEHPPVFVDAVCAVQVSFDLLDILALALGGLRPWSIDTAPATRPGPYRALTGTVAGVPLTLRVQNQMAPGDDSRTFALHQITIGTHAGTLTLAATHGPLLWSTPMRPGQGDDGLFVLDGARDRHLTLPSITILPPRATPTWQDVVGRLWPDAVRSALGDLRDRIASAVDPLAGSQRQLTVARAWQELTGLLGYPEVIEDPMVAPLSSDGLLAMADGTRPTLPEAVTAR